jgi:hypothetical protein
MQSVFDSARDRRIARDRGMVGKEAPSQRAPDFEERDDFSVAMEGDRLAGRPARQRGFLQFLPAPSDGIGEPHYKISRVTIARVIGHGGARPRRIERQGTNLVKPQDAPREAAGKRLTGRSKNAIVDDCERFWARASNRMRRFVRQASAASA